MVRTYKRRPDAKPYKTYTEENLAEAMKAVRTKKMSHREAAREFKVSRTVLTNHLKNRHCGKVGKPFALNPEVELLLVERLKVSANIFVF